MTIKWTDTPESLTWTSERIQERPKAFLRFLDLWYSELDEQGLNEIRYTVEFYPMSCSFRFSSKSGLLFAFGLKMDFLVEHWPTSAIIVGLGECAAWDIRSGLWNEDEPDYAPGDPIAYHPENFLVYRRGNDLELILRFLADLRSVVEVIISGPSKVIYRRRPYLIFRPTLSTKIGRTPLEDHIMECPRSFIERIADIYRELDRSRSRKLSDFII